MKSRPRGSVRSAVTGPAAGRRRPAGRMPLAWFALLAALAPAAALRAEDRREPPPKELEEVGLSEHLGALMPLDVVFADEDGRATTLRQCLPGDRPTILTFNYSSCPMLCSLQLDGLVAGLKDLGWTAGKEFGLVTVSIDPGESPGRAKATRDRYLADYGRAASPAAWRFLTGTEEAVRAAADAAGFRYRKIEQTGEYAHVAALVLLTPQGRIARYLSGVMYDPGTLKMALLEASEGTIGSALDQVLLYCFHYDSATGRYGPTALKLMRLGGAATVAGVGLLLGGLWLREARRRGRTA